MPQRSLVELGREACFALLRTQRVGRLAYCDAVGPVAIPVNFALAGADIVFRVERSNTVVGTDLGLVAFEVDRVEGENQTGWSVVVRGRIAAVELEDVPSLIQQLEYGPPLPWAGGIHNVWMRIRPEIVTGRKLGQPAGPLVI